MGGGSDIVSSLPVKEYFEVRQIEPTVDKLLELAATAPATPKAQIAQLFALRQLAVDADAVKKSAKAADVRKLLRDIADGKKANDATGFAAEYAARTLIALDGGKEKPVKRGTWREGAAWLPKEITFFGGVDSRDARPGDAAADLTAMLAAIPKRDKEQMFDAIEKIGNIRLERIVGGSAARAVPTESANGKIHGDIFVRITGRGNPKWIGDALTATGPGMKLTERKLGNKDVRILSSTGPYGPCMALVGDSDFLMAGFDQVFEFRKPAKDEEKVEVKAEDPTVNLEKMLALAAKPGEDVTSGVLKAELAKVPATASGLLVGAIPPNALKGAPFPSPERIFGHATRGAGGIDVNLKLSMKGKNEAEQIVEAIAESKKSALAALAQAPKKQAPIPINLAPVVSFLESIQTQSDGNGVQLQMLVPADIGTIFSAFFFARM
jgi:hypothetical protein